MVDSGATRCYMSPDIQLAAGINCTASNTFLELADGTQILSAGKAPAVLFSVGIHSFRMDFTVTKLLHGVELVLGMNWLQRVNPLIDWAVPRMLLGGDDRTSAVRGQWIASTEAPGTVKVIQDADLDAMQEPSFCSSLEILKTPTFWRYAPSSLPWRAKDTSKGGVNDQSVELHAQPAVEALVEQATSDGTSILSKRKKRVARIRLCAPDEPARPPKSKLAS